MIDKAATKHSYTVPCSSRFRDAIGELAQAKQCNVADLARSVVLVVPLEAVEAYPDPGGPARDDRETVVLKSGNSKGKPWRRKPRLQVRLAPGYAVETIRKALALALALERGHMKVAIESEQQIVEREREQNVQTVQLRESHEELDRLRNDVQELYFEPLPSGVKSRDQALYVLGFMPGSVPSASQLRMRFRKLATVYHPDGRHGCHQRMSQLNAAMDLLRRGGL